MSTFTRLDVRRGAAAALLALLAAAGCSREEAASPEAGSAIAVTVQPARVETIRDVILAPGSIVPASSGDFTAIVVEPATILELPKAEGDAVQTGDVLARLEIDALSDEVTARQLEISAAKTKAETARAEAQRHASLHERGLVARNIADASRMAAADAETALADAQAKLDALKAQEHRTTIRARFPGVVAKVFRVKGDYVSVPGEPIVRVIDPAKVQVLMQLPLAEFQRVLPGQKATVALVGLPPAPATVAMRTPPADPMSVTADVRLELAVPAKDVTLDMPVQVEILVDERPDALTIPASAVQKDGLTTFVWTAGTDGLAHRKQITVGIVANGRAQVTSGLTAADRVIVSGIAELSEGTPIRVS